MRQVKTKKSSLSLKFKIIIGVIVFLTVGLSIFLVSPVGKKTMKKADEGWQSICQKADLELHQLLIYGHVRTTKEEVMRVLNLAQGMPITEIDLEDIKSRVATLPWVKQVRVERYLPSTLYIAIEEKRPIAVWQNKKKYFPLDEEGKIIPDNTKQLTNLVLVVGTDAPLRTSELISMLSKYPTVSRYVRSAVRIGDRRWNLVMHNTETGTVVYLPESRAEEAMKRLEKLQAKEQILNKDLKVIDLRLEDRLIVQATSMEEDKRKDSKK